MNQHRIGNLSGLTPQYVKENTSVEVPLADPRATRALVALMNQHAVIGGAAAHWGGPAAFAEIMSALFGLFSQAPGHWRDSYNFVNDAGHAENGLYALQANYKMNNLSFEELKGFRSIESKLTGHGENHLYPEGVLLSNGPLGSSIAQAQGLCMSDKLSGNTRSTVVTISDGACMEGEAKEALTSIPGFAAREMLNPFIMIISDNNTKLSGRISEDSFDQRPSFDSLKTLGWHVITIEDGHDLANLYTEFQSAITLTKKSSIKPIAFVVKTIKGKGVKSTEESKSGGHGYPLKAYDKNLPQFINEIYEGEAPIEFTNWANEILNNEIPESKISVDLFPNQVKEKVQIGVASALLKLKKEGLPIVSVTSDLGGSTGVAKFNKEYPESTIDVGVAESNMVSVAAGYSKNGFIPVVDTFAQFGITKGNLPLIMANLSNAPIIAVYSHTGYQDAADGASHQATTYFSALSSIPHTSVFCLSSSSQASEIIEREIKNFQQQRDEGRTPNSLIFFLGRENFPQSYESQTHNAQTIFEGADALIVCTGPMVKEAIEAREILKSDGINVGIFENCQINSPDTKKISQMLEQTNNKLISLEDHQLIGGMGALLTHQLLQDGKTFKYLGLGIKSAFGRSAYCAGHLYENMGISANKAASSIKNFINQR
jgi:transketolase